MARPKRISASVIIQDSAATVGGNATASQNTKAKRGRKPSSKTATKSTTQPKVTTPTKQRVPNTKTPKPIDQNKRREVESSPTSRSPKSSSPSIASEASSTPKTKKPRVSKKSVEEEGRVSKKAASPRSQRNTKQTGVAAHTGSFAELFAQVDTPNDSVFSAIERFGTWMIGLFTAGTGPAPGTTSE
eukprot:jgi/Hompol1/4351/HPOL_003592-RA